VVDNQTALCYKVCINKETNIERIKMKNIVSILAVVAATATSVSAAETNASVNWVGTEVDLEDVCVFTKNEDGKMSYAENADNGGGVWTVTDPAELKVSIRGKSTTLSIKADTDIVRVKGGNSIAADLTTVNHDMYGVTVDYTAGSNPTKILRSHRMDNDRDNVGQVDTTTDAEFTEGNIAYGAFGGKHLEIELGGTATMKYDNAYIDNGDYVLRHTATCLQ
jgi:hypothetical protein